MEEFKSRRKKGHEEGGESWAVSYADLLMVLMSFFIIFFSQDEKDSSNNLLSKIISGLHTQTGAQIIDEEGKPVVAKSAKFFPGFSGKDTDDDVEAEVTINTNSVLERSPASVQTETIKDISSGTNFKLIISRIKSTNIDLQEKESTASNSKENLDHSKLGLQIDLNENIYHPGSYILTNSAQTQLDKILVGLSPYKGKINLVFVGHTDDIPIKGGKKVIESNMILSSLRASKAVEFAISKGFSPYWVSAQGLAEFSRNTRSLSLRVMER